MEHSLAQAEGYHGLFSHCKLRRKQSYSGVATFVRSDSLLRTPASTTSLSDTEFFGTPAGCGLSSERLVEMDVEGRVVVTDHEHFLLFNIYAPCIRCVCTSLRLTHFVARPSNRRTSAAAVQGATYVEDRWQRYIVHYRTKGELAVVGNMKPRYEYDPAWVARMNTVMSKDLRKHEVLAQVATMLCCRQVLSDGLHAHSSP